MGKIRNQLGRNFKTKKRKDKLTEEARSLLMSKIHSKKTSLELSFFEFLKEQGVKFKTHPINVFGRPDLIARNKKVCVFVDSDFWHGWFYPKWKHKLKNQFWRSKIERNRRRDKQVTFKLRREGWLVIRIWEHSLKKGNGSETVRKIINTLA